MPDMRLERRVGARVAGVDEAGRGPLAGPVVAAAVILPRRPSRVLKADLDDSKRIPAARREELFAVLRDHACLGVGCAEVAEIDTINILQATMLAMVRAVAALETACRDRAEGAPDHILVDGDSLPALGCPATAVVGGDGGCLSIAAASIVAKVTRDRMMVDLAAQFPGYGWEHNVGYGTPEHAAALARLGITPHHRRSFAPVRKILEGPRRGEADSAAAVGMLAPGS